MASTSVSTTEKSTVNDDDIKLIKKQIKVFNEFLPETEIETLISYMKKKESVWKDDVKDEAKLLTHVKKLYHSAIEDCRKTKMLWYGGGTVAALLIAGGIYAYCANKEKNRILERTYIE